MGFIFIEWDRKHFQKIQIQNFKTTKNFWYYLFTQVTGRRESGPQKADPLNLVNTVIFMLQSKPTPSIPTQHCFQRTVPAEIFLFEGSIILQ